MDIDRHCALAIFLFSSQTNSDSHVISDGVGRVAASMMVDGFDSMSASQQDQVIATLDVPVRKTAHATEYALLAAGVYVALGQVKSIQSSRGRRLLVAIAICFAFSCTDELHQLFIAGRTGRFTDCLIDTFGATVGALAANGILALRQR